MTERDLMLLKIFAFFGLIPIGGIIGLLVCGFERWLRKKIKKAKQIRTIKHRFDGKPIAQCWCKDCRMHDPEDGKCFLPGIGRHTPDNGFCYEADPIWTEMEPVWRKRNE